MMQVIDVEVMLKFQNCEKLGPGCSNLGCHIHPKTFNMDIVYTSELTESQKIIISNILELPSPDVRPLAFSSVQVHPTSKKDVFYTMITEYLDHITWLGLDCTMSTFKHFQT